MKFDEPTRCEECAKIKVDVRRRINLTGKPRLCLKCFEEKS